MSSRTFCHSLKHSVIQSEAKNLGSINVDVHEILPPFGRLNDKLFSE